MRLKCPTKDSVFPCGGSEGACMTLSDLAPLTVSDDGVPTPMTYGVDDTSLTWDHSTNEDVFARVPSSIHLLRGGGRTSLFNLSIIIPTHTHNHQERITGYNNEISCPTGDDPITTSK